MVPKKGFFKLPVPRKSPVSFISNSLFSPISNDVAFIARHHFHTRCLGIKDVAMHFSPWRVTHLLSVIVPIRCYTGGGEGKNEEGRGMGVEVWQKWERGVGHGSIHAACASHSSVSKNSVCAVHECLCYPPVSVPSSSVCVILQYLCHPPAYASPPLPQCVHTLTFVRESCGDFHNQVTVHFPFCALSPTKESSRIHFHIFS